MVVEFYGEITDYTMRRTDKIKKQYYALWLFGAVVLLTILAVISAAFGEAYLIVLIFAVILGAASAFLYFGPMKTPGKTPRIRCRITIEDDTLTWIQYLPQKTVTKTKKLDRVKRVYKTDFCYYIVFNDIGNAVVCERCLLKRGTFDFFESLFSNKIRIKHIR